jgi:hypothetical protein
MRNREVPVSPDTSDSPVDRPRHSYQSEETAVFIHIHDIYLPYLYPRSVLFYPFASQETALLLALLTNNKHLSVLCCLSALHHDRTNRLRSLLSDYQPQANLEGLCPSYPPKGHFSNSLWSQTC